MADEQDPKQPETDSPDEGGSGTDWKAMARKWEQRAKENSEKAKAYDDLQEASKSELDKAKEAAEKAKAELDSYKAREELAEARRKVAKAAGIPESLVWGATEEEMEANAKLISDYAKPKAGAHGHSGSFDPRGGSDDATTAAKRKLAREIFGSSE